jgi:hypothetical protein
MYPRIILPTVLAIPMTANSIEALDFSTPKEIAWGCDEKKN